VALMSRSAVPGPAWWCEDPELWELLAFEGRYDERGLPVDTHWEGRKQVLQALIRAPAHEYGDFARFLLTQEIRRHRHCWGFGSGIEMAALLVAGDRRAEDVWLLWEAVMASFDTWGILPHRLLFAAGVARTVEYVGGSDHPWRDHLLAHLEEMYGVTDEEVARTLAGRRRRHTGP